FLQPLAKIAILAPFHKASTADAIQDAQDQVFVDRGRVDKAFRSPVLGHVDDAGIMAVLHGSYLAFPPFNQDLAPCRRCHAGDGLEGFGSPGSDDAGEAENLTLLDVKRYVVHRGLEREVPDLKRHISGAPLAAREQ